VVHCSLLLILTFRTRFAQAVPQIKHFVSPEYPPLARRAGLSGQTTFRLTVNNDGRVAASTESASHPLLAEHAKACVEKWTFTPGVRSGTISVRLYFGFAGKPVESDPKTAVTADFAGSSVSVYVTTSPAPNVHP
jgi:TonB family protein